jgi:two-component system sensor histidine kinase VicK
MKNQFSPLSNISFIFDLDRNSFIFVHSSLSAFLKEDEDSSEIYSRIHPDDRTLVSKQFNNLLNGSFHGSAHFRLHLGDEEKWFKVTPFLIRYSSEYLVFGNVMDVTMEERNSHILEKYANKKNSILHMLSHELKGPLHLAKNLSREIRTDPPEESVMISRLQLVYDLIFQAIRIMEDLTNREFLEVMKGALIKRRVNITKKVSEYMQELERSQFIVQRKVNFKSPRKPVYVNIDEAKFMQVINNLVSNALKFTKPGGTISLTIRESASQVIFLFSDNGIGIPDHLQPLIFDEYTAAKRRGLRGEATTGLGLSIVKTIIEWHYGIITVHSIENEGTTFRIEFPKE